MATRGTQCLKSALVTGASRGIGKVVALQLGARGFAVGVNYKSARSDAEDTVRTIRAAGGKAEALQADMSSAEDARELITEAERQLGPLHAFINNAGITRDRLLVQMGESDWNATWLTDFVGPRAAARAALAGMIEREHGRIVNVSSVVGSVGNAGQSNYATAKSAIHGLTRELAVRGAERGVTVNCVVPGYVITDATAHLSTEQQEAWLRQIPMARSGTPTDVADLILFLVSEGAAYITGQCIAVDGGLLAQAEAAGFPTRKPEPGHEPVASLVSAANVDGPD
jgi:3-oxoacyl-[acyl-carrier protein] reductase